MPVFAPRGGVSEPEEGSGDGRGGNGLGSDDGDGEGVCGEVGGNRGCACGAEDAKRVVYEFDSTCKVTFWVFWCLLGVIVDGRVVVIQI